MARKACAADFGLPPTTDRCHCCGDEYLSEHFMSRPWCKACFFIWYDCGTDNTPEGITAYHRNAYANGEYPFGSNVHGDIYAGRLPETPENQHDR